MRDPGPSHFNTLHTLMGLVEVLRSNGRNAESSKMFDELVRVCCDAEITRAPVPVPTVDIPQPITNQERLMRLILSRGRVSADDRLRDRLVSRAQSVLAIVSSTDANDLVALRNRVESMSKEDVELLQDCDRLLFVLEDADEPAVFGVLSACAGAASMLLYLRARKDFLTWTASEVTYGAVVVKTLGTKSEEESQDPSTAGSEGPEKDIGEHLAEFSRNLTPSLFAWVGLTIAIGVFVPGSWFVKWALAGTRAVALAYPVFCIGLWRFVTPGLISGRERMMLGTGLVLSAPVFWATHFIFRPVDAIWSGVWPVASRYPILNISRVVLCILLCIPWARILHLPKAVAEHKSFRRATIWIALALGLAMAVPSLVSAVALDVLLLLLFLHTLVRSEFPVSVRDCG
jgi:hypothetical protein